MQRLRINREPDFGARFLLLREFSNVSSRMYPQAHCIAISLAVMLPALGGVLDGQPCVSVYRNAGEALLLSMWSYLFSSQIGISGRHRVQGGPLAKPRATHLQNKSHFWHCM